MYNSFWGYYRKLNRMAWDLFCPQSSELVIAGAKEECQWSHRFQVRRFSWCSWAVALWISGEMRGQPPLHLLSWKRILGLHLFELHVLNYNFTVICLSFKKKSCSCNESWVDICFFFLRNSWCPQDESCKIKVFLPCVLLLFEPPNPWDQKLRLPRLHGRRERDPTDPTGSDLPCGRLKSRTLSGSGSGLPWNESHTIHGTGIYTYISYKNQQPNVGIYTIHGWYGNTTNTPVYTWKNCRA